VREVVEEQAARHLVTLLHDPDPAASTAIAEWIARDPAHAVAFARAEAAWESTERLRAIPGIEVAPPAPRHWPLIPARPTRRHLLAGGAAAAASVAGLGTFLMLDREQKYSTRVGEVRDVGLADGSLLHLNTDSQVEVQLGPHHRMLQLLRGEAYFDVAHDSSRPFDVGVPGAVVRALGTAFNIRIRDAVVELTVTKGIVGIRPADGTMRKVPAGGTAVIRPRAVAVTKMDQRTVDDRVAWRAGTIVLNGESVAEAVEEFNRYRSAPLVIGDQRVGRLRIGGRFKTDESASFLQALEQTLPVHIVTNDDGSVLLLYADDAA
jgi:transmembrane sensor